MSPFLEIDNCPGGGTGKVAESLANNQSHVLTLRDSTQNKMWGGKLYKKIARALAN